MNSSRYTGSVIKGKIGEGGYGKGECYRVRFGLASAKRGSHILMWLQLRLGGVESFCNPAATVFVSLDLPGIDLGLRNLLLELLQLCLGWCVHNLARTRHTYRQASCCGQDHPSPACLLNTKNGTDDLWPMATGENRHRKLINCWAGRNLHRVR